jgi:hypothetical protein
MASWAAESVERPGSSRSVARRISSVAATFPSSKIPIAPRSRPSWPRMTGRSRSRIGWRSCCLGRAVWRIA